MAERFKTVRPVLVQERGGGGYVSQIKQIFILEIWRRKGVKKCMLLSCVQDRKALSTSTSSLLETSISAAQLEALTGVTAGLCGDGKTLREREAEMQEYTIHTICDARLKPSDEDTAPSSRLCCCRRSQPQFGSSASLLLHKLL